MAGFADGRRAMRSQSLASLGQMPFTNAQKYALHMKADALDKAPPWVNPSLSSNSNAPTDADPLVWQTQGSGTLGQPFIALPTPGAGPVTVLSYSVPRSKAVLIRLLAIAFFGGNDPSGSGQVIWRVLKNGGGLRGLSNLVATIGTLAAPMALPAPIFGVEFDTILVTAEVPASFAAEPVSAGAGTAALFVGFTMNLSQATLPTPGS